MTARFIGRMLPPIHSVAAWLIERRCSAGSCESEVQRHLTCSNIWVTAIEYDSSGLILIKAEMDKAAEKVPGLRVALAHRGSDPLLQWIWSARVVLCAISKIRVQVARCGEADSVDFRVFRGVDQLVKVGRIESSLQAKFPRVRLAGKRSLSAVRKRPVTAA